MVDFQCFSTQYWPFVKAYRQQWPFPLLWFEQMKWYWLEYKIIKLDFQNYVLVLNKYLGKSKNYIWYNKKYNYICLI
jgi:hypothetical protein